ncbi:hypothetical protein [Streptomyces sp. NBC_00454]|uniref:hypothetical protein n=1 Tax=Streptomyces sp. NBC_00454 TaxID=2975747 RepID=UPI0030E5ADBC
MGTRGKPYQGAGRSAPYEAGGGAPGSRVAVVWPILVALVAGPACWLVFSVCLPADIARYADYVAARPCAAAAPSTAGESAGEGAGERGERTDEDCLRLVPATIEATVVKEGGKTPRFDATVSTETTTYLSVGPARRLMVPFRDPGPLLNRLRPGDRVTATFWRGDLVLLDKDGIRQSTRDAPRDGARITAGIGTFVGLLAAMGLGMGFLGLRPAGRRRARLFGWDSVGKQLGLALMLICAAAVVVVTLLDAPWWAVPAAAVPLAASTSLALYRYRLRW